MQANLPSRQKSGSVCVCVMADSSENSVISLYYATFLINFSWYDVMLTVARTRL